MSTVSEAGSLGQSEAKSEVCHVQNYIYGLLKIFLTINPPRTVLHNPLFHLLSHQLHTFYRPVQ